MKFSIGQRFKTVETFGDVPAGAELRIVTDLGEHFKVLASYDHGDGRGGWSCLSTVLSIDQLVELTGCNSHEDRIRACLRKQREA